jgi:hypothetical protein
MGCGINAQGQPTDHGDALFGEAAGHLSGMGTPLGTGLSAADDGNGGITESGKFTSEIQGLNWG